MAVGDIVVSDLDIEIVEALIDWDVFYLKHKIGMVWSDHTHGYIFVPIGDFNEPNMEGCEADTLDELIDRIDTEISCVRDLLDAEIERGM